MFRMEAVSEPQISPDGQWVAYLVGTSDRDADELRSAIWMVSWDGKQQLQMTQPSSSISEPRWSPDGRYLSYLAKIGEAEHSQVMVLDRRGGEARALTSVTDDIEGYEWSPDGRRLVLVIETNEEPSTAAITAKGPKPIVIDSMFFKEDVTGYIGRHQKQHLYLFDIAEAKTRAARQDRAIQRCLARLVAGRNEDRLRAYPGTRRGHGRQDRYRAHRGAARRRAAPVAAPLGAHLPASGLEPGWPVRCFPAGPGAEVLDVHAR